MVKGGGGLKFRADEENLGQSAKTGKTRLEALSKGVMRRFGGISVTRTRRRKFEERDGAKTSGGGRNRELKRGAEKERGAPWTGLRPAVLWYR